MGEVAVWAVYLRGKRATLAATITKTLSMIFEPAAGSNCRGRGLLASPRHHHRRPHATAISTSVSAERRRRVFDYNGDKYVCASGDHCLGDICVSKDHVC